MQSNKELVTGLSIEGLGIWAHYNGESVKVFDTKQSYARILKIGLEAADLESQEELKEQLEHGYLVWEIWPTGNTVHTPNRPGKVMPPEIFLEFRILEGLINAEIVTNVNWTSDGGYPFIEVTVDLTRSFNKG